jgi:uncharacterized Zn finger protein
MDFDKVNLNANTTYDDVINITVNSAQSGNYDISVSNEPSGMDVNFDGSNSVSGVSAGSTVQADVTIDTSGDTTAQENDIDDDIRFTVTAQ